MSEKNFSGTVNASGGVSDNIAITVTRFYERILASAGRLRDDALADSFSFAAAIVLASTACEVATQRAIDALIDARGLGSIGEVLKDYPQKYTLFNDKKLLALWSALAGDDIQTTAFWLKYTDHVKLRNKAVHNGMDGERALEKADADSSIAVAANFIAHIKSVLTANGLGHLA